VALRTSLTGLSQSEADLRKYYDEHKNDFVQVCLSHILVKSSKEDAEAALARIKRGEDFAAVAKAVSEDPGSKDKGGDLGCSFAGLFVKEFADAAVSAPIGTPTDPVQTQFGFHILLVKDRPQAPFEAVRTQVKTNLNNESQGKFRDFLGKAAQQAKVTVDPRYGTFKIDPGSNSAPEVVPPNTPAPAEGRPGTTAPGGAPLDQLPGDTGETTPSTTAP
jgi:parvulin-like peptidyl-prolyl cis-trans isomerase-like protein